MAKRKTKQDMDIAVDEAVQPPAAEPVSAGQPEPPMEKAIPELTVRIFPVKNARSKLRATANVNIAGAFAIQGFEKRVVREGAGAAVCEGRYTTVAVGILPHHQGGAGEAVRSDFTLL